MAEQLCNRTFPEPANLSKNLLASIYVRCAVREGRSGSTCRLGGHLEAVVKPLRDQKWKPPDGKYGTGRRTLNTITLLLSPVSPTKCPA